MANKKDRSRKTQEYHHRSILEVIEEESELESIHSMEVTKIKTSGRDFKPFLSSWRTNNIGTTGSFRSKGITSEENLKKQIELLKSDHMRLLESLRLKELEKQAFVSRLGELEEKCHELENLVKEGKEKLSLEVMKAKQMKTDYEFMMDIQNKKFKRREKELLEQIHSHAIISDEKNSIEKDSLIPTIDTFEYEEMYEKLKSFERQNELLQSSKDIIETQYEELYETLTDLKRSHGSLKLKYNELKIHNSQPKWLRMQLGINKTPFSVNISTLIENPENESRTIEEPCEFKTKYDEDKLDILQEAPSECEKKVEGTKPKLNCDSIPTSETSPIVTDIPQHKCYCEVNFARKMLLAIQNTSDIKLSDQLLSSECSSEMKQQNQRTSNNEIENHNNLKEVSENKDFLAKIRILFAKICAQYRKIEEDSDNFSQSFRSTDSKKSIFQTNLEECQTMNLSDSEKIIKGNIFIGKDSNKEDVQKKIEQNLSGNKKREMKLTHETTENDLDIQNQPNKNKKFPDEIMKLDIENLQQKTEYDTLLNSTGENQDLLNFKSITEMEQYHKHPSVHTLGKTKFEEKTRWNTVKHFDEDIEYTIKDLCKRDNWREHSRARKYDIRRNIDFNTLYSEIVDEL